MRASPRLRVSPTPSSFLLCSLRRVEKIWSCYFAAALSRLLQSLQNFGQVVPFSVLPAAFVSFHSAAHFVWRSRAASWPALGPFFVWQPSRMPSTAARTRRKSVAAAETRVLRQAAG